MKTPVYDGEEGKISPSCLIWEPTVGVSMLLEKAAGRRLILPAVLRELFLTGCALKPAVMIMSCSRMRHRSAFEYFLAGEVSHFRSRKELKFLKIEMKILAFKNESGNSKKYFVRMLTFENILWVCQWKATFVAINSAHNIQWWSPPKGRANNSSILPARETS